MFISGSGGYNRDGEQFYKGRFLCLFNNPFDNSAKELRACVVQTKFTQLGHWMMGSAKIRGYSIGLSGSYGSDGLPLTLYRHFIGVEVVNGKKEAQYKGFNDEEKRNIWDNLIPLPSELYDAWNKGEGWNGAGKEGPAMKEWAIANFVPLVNAAKKNK